MDQQVKRIEFEGKVHEFPPDFTDEEIRQALSGGAATTPPKTGALSNLKDMAIGAAKGLGRQGLAAANIFMKGSNFTPGYSEAIDAATSKAQDVLHLRPTGGHQTFGGWAADAATVAANPGKLVSGLQPKASRAVAESVMRWGVRPSPKITKEFPGVVGHMLDEGIGLSPAGHTKFTAAVRGSNNQVIDELLKAENVGKTIQGIDVIPAGMLEARKRVGSIAKRGDQAKASKLSEKVESRATGFDQPFEANFVHPSGSMAPIAAHENKLSFQADAEQAFRQMLAGQKVKEADLLTNQGMARSYREAIEGAVPAVAPINARTQRLIGIGTALDAANAKSGGHVLSEYFTVAGALSGNAQVALPAMLLARPQLASKIALAVDSLGKKPDLLSATVRGLFLEAALATGGGYADATRPMPSHPVKK